jgi:hypothetical protein
MKRLLAMLLVGILGLSLFPALTFAQGVPGGHSLNECCAVKHDLDKLVGDDNTSTLGPRHGNWVRIDNTAVCDAPTGATFYDSRSWAAYCTIDAVYTATDWIFWVVFVVAAIIIVVAGFMFMTASGDPEKVKKARMIFIYGLVGVVVAVIAKFIPAFARYFIGA